MNLTVSFAILVMLVLLVLLPLRAMEADVSRGTRFAWFSCLGVFCVAILLRWPSANSGYELNLDESQMLAQAMRFLDHPVPWRDVDGTTSGPLNSLFLTQFLALGVDPSYRLVRILHLMNQIAGFGFLYLAAAKMSGHARVGIGMLPALVLVCFLSDPNFVHYSSESLSVLLISIALYLLSWEKQCGVGGQWRIFILGLIVGSLPFAKLQTVLLAGLLTVAGLISIARSEFGRDRFRCVSILMAGCVCVPAILFCIVCYNHSFGDFIISYVQAPAQYTKELWSLRLENFLKLTTRNLTVTPYLVVLFAFLCWIIIGSWKVVLLVRPLRWPNHVVAMMITCIFGIGIALFSVLIAGKAFAHYLQLTFPFAGLLWGLCYCAGGRLWIAEDRRDMERRRVWCKGFVGMAIVLQIPMVWAYSVRNSAPNLAPDVRNEVVAAIHRHAPLAKSMSIWGWEPYLFVQSGLEPATRDAIGHFVITEGPFRKYYLNRYLADLVTARPPVFVDAIASGANRWSTWTLADRHESVPALADYIENNYSLVSSIDLGKGGEGPVRVYVLRGNAGMER